MLASNELVGEVGFDCTCQRCLVGSPNSIDIAAIRAFLGHNGNPTPDLSCSGSVGADADHAKLVTFGLQRNHPLEPMRKRVKRVRDRPARFEPKLRSGLSAHAFSALARCHP